MSSKPRLVPCPRCRQPAAFDAGNRWRPFCSERCASIDLGAWASEAYRVASTASGEVEGDAPTPDDPQPVLKGRDALL